MQFVEKHWKILAVILIVVIILSVTYRAGKNTKPGFWDWLISFQGDGSGKGMPDPKDLPNNGQGIPTGWDPDNLAKRLHDAMEGWNAFYPAEEFNELAQLATDDMVVAVYNHFNQVYGDGETLYEWIDSEWSAMGTIEKENALNRLERVNCT